MTTSTRTYLSTGNIAFVFDAAMSQNMVDDSEVTEHPVEDGFTAADHVRHLPLQVELDVVVSNTPLGETAGPVIRVSNDTVLDNPFVGNHRAEDFLAELTRAKRMSARFNVFASQLDQSDVPLTVSHDGFFITPTTFVLKTIAVRRTKDTGNILRMDLTLKELRVVSSRVVTAPFALILPPGDKGNKPTRPADCDEEDKAFSWVNGQVHGLISAPKRPECDP